MKLVTFKQIGGVDCYYARVNKAYEDPALCTKSRVRKLHPDFLRAMDACLAELKWLTIPLGPLEALTSGGAWVPTSAKRPNPKDWHVQGKAFDLGGLFWDDGTDERTILTCLNVATDYYAGFGPDHFDGQLEEYRLYLGVEAVLRRHFGTVLGIHYNEDHHNHWHIDPGTPVGFWTSGFGSSTRVRFLQEALTHIWHLDVGNPDGVCGKLTRAGIKAIRAQFNLDPLVGLNRAEVWRHLLLLTAMQAIMRS